jgi:hypothetical protein
MSGPAEMVAALAGLDDTPAPSGAPVRRVNTEPRLVLRAQNAMRRTPDTRAIKRELQHGNPYMVALLHVRGLVYLRGTGIVRTRDTGEILAPSREYDQGRTS